MLDDLPPEIFFSGERVVSSAAQREVGGLVLAAPSKCLQMVQLEAARFVAPLA